MKLSINHKTRYLVIIGALLLVSACATSTLKTSIIEERATTRWEKLLSGDFDGAYEYLSPGFRSSVSSIQYQRSILLKRVRWTDAEFKRSECTETSCDVMILLSFNVSGALPGVKSYDGKKDIVEKWVLVDGMWYLVP
jgi:hypothetical protein